MYVRRGADVYFDVGEKEPTDSLELRLDYIDCLVMVKVFADNGYSYFTTGVGLGFLTQATLKDIRADEKDVGSLFRDVDVSVAFGVGFMVPARNTLVTFELRYQQSLVNMFDPDADPSSRGARPATAVERFSAVGRGALPAARLDDRRRPGHATPGRRPHSLAILTRKEEVTMSAHDAGITNRTTRILSAAPRRRSPDADVVRAAALGGPRAAAASSGR